MVNNKILEYNHDKVIVEENDDSYVIGFQRGLGEVSYSKKRLDSCQSLVSSIYSKLQKGNRRRFIRMVIYNL